MALSNELIAPLAPVIADLVGWPDMGKCRSNKRLYGNKSIHSMAINAMLDAFELT